MNNFKIVIVIAILFFVVLLVAETNIIEPANFNDVDAGSENNPFIIDNIENLGWLSETELYWGSEDTKYYFIQTADIDAAETEQWNRGLGFQPIGNLYAEVVDGEETFEHHRFYGDYNGNYHTISNLFINIDTTIHKYSALFGNIQSSTIKNLNLIEINVNGENAELSGGLCGFVAWSSNILNCYVSGTIRGSNTVGGLAGLVRGSSINKSGCDMHISGSGTLNNIGGLVGHSTDNEISNCYTINTIEPENNTTFGGLISFSNISNITNCFSVTTYSGTFYGMGGLFGTALDSNINSCLWNEATSGLTQAWASNTNSSFVDTGGYSTEQMGIQATYESLGWDFQSVWTMSEDDNDSYPFLSWQLESTPIDDNDVEFMDSKSNNYPNPFNPETTISYDVAQSGSVTVDIYNLKGQKVKSLLNENQEAGKHSIIWQGDNDDGKQVGSGTYFYRVKSGEQEVVKKMMLLK